MYFRQLHSGLKLDITRLKKIGELIYRTDDYIYPDMFGSETIAAEVIPELLRSGADPMFSLDNLFVCEYAGEPVALILWCQGQLDWSAEPLRKVLRAQGHALPPNLDAVEREYVSGYGAEERKEVISVLNVCVDPQMRGSGVGKRIFKAFLREHAQTPMELCVLSDNEAAIRLYESCGFRVCGEEPAYPSEKPNHFRKLMKR